jgi:hypothetical protein
MADKEYVPGYLRERQEKIVIRNGSGDKQEGRYLVYIIRLSMPSCRICVLPALRYH